MDNKDLDPEFSFKSSNPIVDQSKFKVPLSNKKISIDLDKPPIEQLENNSESPKFNVGPLEFDNVEVNNSEEIPKGIDFASTVKHQIDLNNNIHNNSNTTSTHDKHDSHNNNSHDNKEKYFSNNSVYNKKEEIEYAKKSHLEYMKLIKDNKDPLGVHMSGGLKNYTMKDVAKHNNADDLWTVLHGGVYNLTIYLDYHPGGRKKLLMAAGRDATDLFNKYHPWVNYHNLIGKLQIGYLVEEN